MKIENLSAKVRGYAEIGFNKSVKAIRCMAEHLMRMLHRFRAWFVVHKEEMGYYAVLTLVLVALGAAANDYRNKRDTQKMIAEILPQEPGISVQSKPDQTLPPEKEKQEYILPVQGAIIGDFSDSELVWSTTLQLWQIHPAIDIAAAMGEAVVAAADGMITEAYNDALYGNVIVIEHENGVETRYSSLNTLKLVQVGQKVYQGDIISAVGTCDAEADLGAHVHMEYLVNQSPKDFSIAIDSSEVNSLQD